MIQNESQEEFNNRYKKFKTKCIEIEKNYLIRNSENFVTYFEEFKLVQIREKMNRYATKKFKTKEHGQNPIEWLNYLSKDEIDTHGNVKQSHRHASILTCTKKLKNRSLRLYTNAIKAIYSEGPYILSTAFTHLKHTCNEFMDMEREEEPSLIKRLFTYTPNERVLLNCGYILGEEEISLSETQVTSYSHYKTQENLREDVSDRSLTNVQKLNCQESLRNDVHEVSSENGQT